MRFTVLASLWLFDGNVFTEVSTCFIHCHLLERIGSLIVGVLLLQVSETGRVIYELGQGFNLSLAKDRQNWVHASVRSISGAAFFSLKLLLTTPILLELSFASLPAGLLELRRR